MSCALASASSTSPNKIVEDALITVFSFCFDIHDSERTTQIFIDFGKVCKSWKRAASQFGFLLKHAKLLNFRQISPMNFKSPKCRKARMIERSLLAPSLPFTVEYQVSRQMVLLYANVFLSTSDILSCRLVSRSWKRAATDWALLSAARKELVIAVKEKQRLIGERVRAVGAAAIAAVDEKLQAVKDRHDSMKRIQSYLMQNGGLKKIIGKPCHTFPGSPKVARLRLTNLAN